MGKEPLVLWLFATLLFVNPFLGLLLDFAAKNFLPRASDALPACEALKQKGVQYHAPGIVCWYASRSIGIQFILLAVITAIFIIFRKRVRYSRTR